MKKTYFYLLLLSSFYVNAQEQLDEEFLKSLPTDIRNDFIKEMGENAQKEDQIFTAPRTSIKTLTANLQQIKLDLRAIEEELMEKEGASPSGLSRFGVDFFNSFQSTFMPINEPNVSDDYVVDYGDTLNVQLIGKDSEALSLVVRADGTITLPEVGRIVVAGLQLERVDELVRARVTETLLGTESFTTLAHIRDINVLIVGNVRNPGVYTLSGASNVLSLLNAAGGIDARGSFRAISHKRDNKVIRNIDLYDVLINGNLSFGYSLRSGDSIVVNPKGSEVSVSGGVANPAVYELSDQDNLGTLIRLAGGLIPGASNIIRIERSANSSKRVFQAEYPNNSNFQLTNGDDVKVTSYSPFSSPIQTVELSGEVVNPGLYTIEEGETLSALLTRAGGYKRNAYEYGGILIRESAKAVEKSINERIYQDMIKFIATSANAKEIVSGGSNLPLILSEFKNTEPVGRITAEFDINKLKRAPSLDTTLAHNDKIFIPAFTQEIYVLGEVITPGARLYNPKNSAKDYIKKSGGVGLYADSERIVVISPNGDSYLWSGGLFGLTQSKLSITPGTVIYVPREIGKLDGLNYASAIAPIFSSLALSLASLNSIND